MILLTDHTQPHCFTVDLILRNLPPQESFVVEWKYPVMVERVDLEPEGEEDARDDKRQPNVGPAPKRAADDGGLGGGGETGRHSTRHFLQNKDQTSGRRPYHPR
jgi:hypothetical protein